MPRELEVAQFITYDGVIQGPSDPSEDTDGGFTHGGWFLPFWHDDLGAHFFKTIAACDTLLLGRKTWQMHGDAFEPMVNGDNPFADVLNGKKKFVVSKTLASAAAWRDTTIIRGNVVDEVRRLKASPGKNIRIDGSSMLLNELIAHDLVDTFYLMVVPIVLGSGKRIFPANHRVDLKLIETIRYPTGVTLMHYARAG